MLLLLHASPERCFRTFQSLWIVFFVFVLFAHLRQGPRNGGSDSLADDRHARWILASAIFLGIVVYLPTLHFNFVSDDYTLLEMGREPFRQAMHEYFLVGQVDSSGAAIFYRPIAFATVNIEYLLWHESIPAYHLACIVLHVLCVFGLYRLCRELDLTRDISATAALLFAVLPVNVQTITWATARFDRFAAAAMLWSLVLYVRYRTHRHWPAFIGALLLLLVAVECKEFAFVLPLLAVALEFVMPMDQRKGAALRVGAFSAAAAAAFVWRMHLIHGIGGYHTVSGDSSVLHLGRAFKAVTVRAPGETLFGYNWLYPFGPAFLLVAALAAALLIYLAATYRPGPYWRISLFAIAMIVLPVGPGHFLFWWSDPGLVFSRALYFSATGMALLLALISQRRQARARYFSVALLVILFAVAQQHNIAAWRANSNLTERFLAELKRIQPQLKPNALLCVERLPTHVYGVQFFDVNPTAAARYVYGEQSQVKIERAEDGCATNAAAAHVAWDERAAVLKPSAKNAP